MQKLSQIKTELFIEPTTPMKFQSSDNFQINSCINKNSEKQQNEEAYQNKNFDDQYEECCSSSSTSTSNKFSFDALVNSNTSNYDTPLSSKSVSCFSKTKTNFLRTRNLKLDLNSEKRTKLEKLLKLCKNNNFNVEIETNFIQQANYQSQKEDFKFQSEILDNNNELQEDRDQNEQKSLYEQKYIELEELGRGSQAVVKKIQEIATGNIYAAKLFLHMNDDEIKIAIKNEYETLSKISHPNILKVYELIEQEHQTIMIMEYVQGDNLQVLKYQNLSIEQIVFIIKELIKIIEFIHEKNIIHRDLQNKNVLFDKATNQLKLIDFGIAKTVILNELNLTQCGDQFYMAPEMIQGLGYNEKVDIYQIGCLFYELVEQIPQIKSSQIIKKVKKSCLEFRKTPDGLKPLILQMLSIDQMQRISEPECLKFLEQSTISILTTH